MKKITRILLLVFIPFISGAQSDINYAHLDKLQQAIEHSHSTAFIIYKDTQLIKEWYSADFINQPRELCAMSVSKSIVVLAIAKLLDMGKIETGA